MTLPCSSGAPKIPKQSKNDKAMRGLRQWATPFLLACVLFGHASVGWALPVQIAWQVPLNKSETYTLEVASDPGFGTIVHKAQIQGSTAYAWDAPGEAVYHWRLARPDQKGQGGDVVTFVSGSFVAIDPEAPREHPAHIAWEAQPGADRYKLYVIDGAGKARTMISTTASFVVPATDKALMIEVVPYSGSQRLFQHYHFNPTLTLDTGVLPPPPPPAPVVADVPAASESATPPEVSPSPEVTPAEEPEQTAPAVVARPRVHLVHAYALSGRETLHLQKLDVNLEDTGPIKGGGAGVWTNPIDGLIVSASGSYHEHKADLKQADLFADQVIRLSSSRYTAEMTIGWDVLASFNSRWHRLIVSFAGVGTQLPYLPLSFDSQAGTPPKLGKKALTLLGGNLAYGYFGTHVAAIVDAGMAQAETDDVKIAHQSLLLEFYVSERTALHVGAMNRLTESARCDPNRDTCLTEGKAHTTSKEAFAMVGVGVVFR